jgi:hypothetical protein
MRHGKIAVGRDTRLSGEMLLHALKAGLLSSGCDIVDCGILPTPALQFIVKEKFDGGAGSRYPARREIHSFWYPTWLAQPAALVPDSKLIFDIELLKINCTPLLAGNHDWAAIGLTDIQYFNEYAKAAILWTREVLTPESRKFIKTLPISKDIKKENMLLVHSTPKDPEAWHYLLTLWDAEINFHYFSHRLCFIGHSHLPFVIERVPSGEMITYKSETRLGKTFFRQPILGLIAKQLQMNGDEFEDLLKGKLSSERYKRILTERGIIE